MPSSLKNLLSNCLAERNTILDKAFRKVLSKTAYFVPIRKNDRHGRYSCFFAYTYNILSFLVLIKVCSFCPDSTNRMDAMNDSCFRMWNILKKYGRSF